MADYRDNDDSEQPKKIRGKHVRRTVNMPTMIAEPKTITVKASPAEKASSAEIDRLATSRKDKKTARAAGRGDDIEGSSMPIEAVAPKKKGPSAEDRIESSVAYPESDSQTGVSELEGEAYPESVVPREEYKGFKMPPGLSVPQRRAWRKSISDREETTDKSAAARRRSNIRETGKGMGKSAYGFVEPYVKAHRWVGRAARDPEVALEAGEFIRSVGSGDKESRKKLAEGASMGMVEPAATAGDVYLTGEALGRGKYGEAALYGASVLLPWVSAGWLKTAMKAGEIPPEAAKKIAELEKRYKAGDVTDDMQIRRELAAIEDAHVSEYNESLAEYDSDFWDEGPEIGASGKALTDVDNTLRQPGESMADYKRRLPHLHPETQVSGQVGRNTLTAEQIEAGLKDYADDMAKVEDMRPRPGTERTDLEQERFHEVLSDIQSKYHPDIWYYHDKGGVGSLEFIEDYDLHLPQPTEAELRAMREGTGQYGGGTPGGGGAARSLTDDSTSAGNMWAGQRQDSYSGADREMFDYLTTDTDPETADAIMYIDELYGTGKLSREQALKEYDVIAKQKQYDDWVDPDAHPNIDRPQTMYDRAKAGGSGMGEFEAKPGTAPSTWKKGGGSLSKQADDLQSELAHINESAADMYEHDLEEALDQLHGRYDAAAIEEVGKRLRAGDIQGEEMFERGGFWEDLPPAKGTPGGGGGMGQAEYQEFMTDLKQVHSGKSTAMPEPRWLDQSRLDELQEMEYFEGTPEYLSAEDIAKRRQEIADYFYWQEDGRKNLRFGNKLMDGAHGEAGNLDRAVYRDAQKEMQRMALEEYEVLTAGIKGDEVNQYFEANARRRKQIAESIEAQEEMAKAGGGEFPGGGGSRPDTFGDTTWEDTIREEMDIEEVKESMRRQAGDPGEGKKKVSSQPAADIPPGMERIDPPEGIPGTEDFEYFSDKTGKVYSRRKYTPLDPGEVDHPAHVEKMARERSMDRWSEHKEMAKRGESFERVRGGKSFDGRRPESFIENYDQLSQDEIDFITHERNFVIGDPNYPEPPIPSDYNLHDSYRRPEFVVPEGMNLGNTLEDRRRLMLRPTLYTTRPIKGTDEYASYIEAKHGTPGGGGLTKHNKTTEQAIKTLTAEVDKLPNTQYKKLLLAELDEVKTLADVDELRAGYELMKEKGFPTFTGWTDPSVRAGGVDPETGLRSPTEAEIQEIIEQGRFGDPTKFEILKEDMRRMAELEQQGQTETGRVRRSRTPGAPGASGKIPEGTSRAKHKGTRRERPKLSDIWPEGVDE